jgi:NADPH:quinone reductase-like Zn-dependent oxidoreductase
VRDLTHGRGVEVAFESAGMPTLQRLAVEVVRPGGRAVLVGLAGESEEVCIPSYLFAIREKQVRVASTAPAIPLATFRTPEASATSTTTGSTCCCTAESNGTLHAPPQSEAATTLHCVEPLIGAVTIR